MRNRVSKIFFNNPKRREEVIELVEDNLKFIIADMAVELKDWQPEFYGDSIECKCHGLLLDKIIELMQTHFAETLGGKPEEYKFGRYAQEIAGDYDPDDTTLVDTFKFDFVVTHLHEVIPPVRAYRAMGVA